MDVIKRTHSLGNRAIVLRMLLSIPNIVWIALTSREQPFVISEGMINMSEFCAKTIVPFQIVFDSISSLPIMLARITESVLVKDFWSPPTPLKNESID